MGRPIEEGQRRHLLDADVDQSKALAEVLESLKQAPGTGRVGDAPLNHLAAAQSGPDALGFTLCRRVGHSAAPMAL